MCASEDFARTDHRTVTVDLDADDVLFDLDNDATTTTHIRSAPRPVDAPARSDVDEAIADAIAHTPTPGALPGTLLCRAEAAHAQRLGTQMKYRVARM